MVPRASLDAVHGLTRIALVIGAAACASSPAAPNPAIMRSAPHPDAPAELALYGRLVGSWRCQMSAAQPDGTWKPGATSTWTFFYALGGKAIQDVWVPDGDGAVGTNLRLYDPATRTWTMVWASAAQTFFDEFTARADGDRIVMHGDRRAREAFGAHRARITFSEVTRDHFTWTYEATAPGADGPWQPIQRLQCAKAARGPAR